VLILTAAFQTVEHEDLEDINTFKNGQSHRARLNEKIANDIGPDPWEQSDRQRGQGGRGGRASARGRGGGVVGSRGRGDFGRASR
jgi:hypothetical protein